MPPKACAFGGILLFVTDDKGAVAAKKSRQKKPAPGEGTD